MDSRSRLWSPSKGARSSSASAARSTGILRFESLKSDQLGSPSTGRDEQTVSRRLHVGSRDAVGSEPRTGLSTQGGWAMDFTAEISPRSSQTPSTTRSHVQALESARSVTASKVYSPGSGSRVKPSVAGAAHEDTFSDADFLLSASKSQYSSERQNARQSQSRQKDGLSDIYNARPRSSQTFSATRVVSNASRQLFGDNGYVRESNDEFSPVRVGVRVLGSLDSLPHSAGRVTRTNNDSSPARSTTSTNSAAPPRTPPDTRTSAAATPEENTRSVPMRPTALRHTSQGSTTSRRNDKISPTRSQMPLSRLGFNNDRNGHDFKKELSPVRPSLLASAVSGSRQAIAGTHNGNENELQSKSGVPDSRSERRFLEPHTVRVSTNALSSPTRPLEHEPVTLSGKPSQERSVRSSAFSPSPGRIAGVDRRLDFDALAAPASVAEDNGERDCPDIAESKSGMAEEIHEDRSTEVQPVLNELTKDSHGALQSTPAPVATLQNLASLTTPVQSNNGEDENKWQKVAELLDMAGFDGSELRKSAHVKGGAPGAVERALQTVLRDYNRQKQLIERSMKATRQEDQTRKNLERDLQAANEALHNERRLNDTLNANLAKAQELAKQAREPDAVSQQAEAASKRKWETRARKMEEEFHRVRDQLEIELQLGQETRRKARDEFERLLGRRANPADARLVQILEGFVQDQLRGIKTHIVPLQAAGTTTMHDDTAIVTARSRDEIRDFAKRVCELVLAHSSPEDAEIDARNWGEPDEQNLIDEKGWFPSRVVARVVPQISRWISKAEQVEKLAFWRDQIFEELGVNSEEAALRALKVRLSSRPKETAAPNS